MPQVVVLDVECAAKLSYRDLRFGMRVCQLPSMSERGFLVAIIPHRAKVTTLGIKQVNDSVNLETDIIGKYVERLLQERSQLPKSTPVIDKDYLQKHGLI